MEDSSGGRLPCPALMAADGRSNNTATDRSSAEDGKGRPNSTDEDIIDRMLEDKSDTAGIDAGKLVCRQEALSGMKVHACEYAGCGARFSRPSRLEVHYRTHTGERPFVCGQSGCDRSYARRQHLLRHQATAHGGHHSPFRQTYQCPEEGCGRQLGSAHSFRRHARSHRRRQHACADCGERFLRRELQRQHVCPEKDAAAPPLPPPLLQCPRPGCGRQLQLPSQLRAHLRRHQQHTCSSCGEQVASWRQLVQHRREMHAERTEHKCPECDNTFLTNSALKIHTKVHAETRDIFHCPFDDCPRYYYFRRNLNSHIRSSHEGKGFICPVETCKKKLVSKQKLDQHARLHDPQRAATAPARSRRKRKPRRDRGVARGPVLSALEQLTGQRDRPPQQQLPVLPLAVQAEEVAAAVTTAADVFRQCARPSGKRQQLTALPQSGHMARLAESESESHSDDCQLP